MSSESSEAKKGTSSKPSTPRSGGNEDKKQLLWETFNVTHEAVKLDRLSIYVDESRRLYQEVSQRFDLLQPFLPQEIGGVIRKFSQTYYFRSRSIQNQSGHKKFKPHPTLKKKYLKWKKRLPDCELAIEKVKAKRPLWLMRNIKRTIRCHGGSYILPDFYIPKQVWSQRGYQLRYLKEKVDLFICLTDAMRCAVVAKNRQDAVISLKSKIMKGMEKYSQGTDSTKEKVLKKAVALQEKRAKKISKKRRRMSVLKNLEPNYNEEYVASLVTFVDSAEFLESWIDDSLRTNNRIQYAALEDIASNLYFKILHKIVFKDIENLLKVFFRRCRQQFTGLGD